MGKSTPSAPSQPDPSFLASQQSKANQTAAMTQQIMNQTNQTGPYGSLKYNYTGDFDLGNGNKAPQFSADVTLSPEQQKLYEGQTRISQGALDLGQGYVDRIRQSQATPFSYDGMPDPGPVPTYDKDFRQHTYDTILQRNQPNVDHDRAALTQRLADQGIGLQDPAYATAQRQFDTGVNDFRLGADIQSQGQASQDFSTAAQGYGLKVDQRTRAIQEELARRNQPVNELTALLGFGGSGVREPSFVNTPQVQVNPVDTAGIYANDYAGKMAQYQTQMQQNNAAMGGLAGLAGTLGGFALAGPMGGAIGSQAGGLFGLGGRRAPGSGTIA